MRTWVLDISSTSRLAGCSWNNSLSFDAAAFNTKRTNVWGLLLKNSKLATFGWCRTLSLFCLACQCQQQPMLSLLYPQWVIADTIILLWGLGPRVFLNLNGSMILRKTMRQELTLAMGKLSYGFIYFLLFYHDVCVWALIVWQCLWRDSWNALLFHFI